MRRHLRAELHLGDCLVVLKTIAARSVHCVIIDPPFGSTDCHWDQVPDLAAMWVELDRVTTEGAVFAIFCAQPFTTALINSRPKWFRYDLVWDKIKPVGHLNANRQPMRQHEQVLIFSRRPSASVYRPQMLPGKPYRMTKRANDGGRVYRGAKAHVTVNLGTRHPTSILRFAKPGRERRHPTEKPVTLLAWLVHSYSLPGQTVLDAFMGSASTIEAAVGAGRRAIGIERDLSIYRTAVERVSMVLRPSQFSVVGRV